MAMAMAMAMAMYAAGSGGSLSRLLDRLDLLEAGMASCILQGAFYGVPVAYEGNKSGVFGLECFCHQCPYWLILQGFLEKEKKTWH